MFYTIANRNASVDESYITNELDEENERVATQLSEHVNVFHINNEMDIIVFLN